MNTKKWITLLICVSGFSMVSQAAEELAPLTEIWEITVADDNREFFEDALKEHMQYRVNKGDPQTWAVYTPVVGEQLNTYQIRACCTDWIEIEGHNEWAKGAKTANHWRNTVAPYVSKTEHYYYHFDAPNSNWDYGQFNYFSVNTSKPIPGKTFQLQKAIQAMSVAAKEMGLPLSWGWFHRIGGEPEVQLVVAYQSYSDMMPMNKPFFQQISEYLNSKEEAQSLLEQYGESFSETHYSIVILRNDLSSPSTTTKD